ncbi:MAG: DUF3386 family protein [Candidatus Rokubacteria bacterium]|nr:DUF3386 family protein [Candidatus Rokubacteria bacterium]
MIDTHVRDGSGAVHLLQRAQGAFQKWPEGFAGFRARARCRALDREAVGTIRVTPGPRVEARLGDPDLARLVEAALREIAEARTPRFFKDGDGRFPIMLAADAGDGVDRAVVVQRPEGRVVYWIDAAGRMQREEREAGGMLTVTTFEEFARATPGRRLPTRFARVVSEQTTGRLLVRETVADSHVRLDHVWLPAYRSISSVQVDIGQRVLIELDRHALV